MRVAAVQYKATRGRKAQALAELATLADEARGADLVVLPEMAATGYLFDSPAHVAAVAEPARGPTLAALGPVAAARKAWVVIGFAEADRDRFYNSALVIDPSGALAFVYRKTLLYDADWTWASPGDSGYRAFDAERGRFTLGICMDLNDDAFVLWCRQAAVRAVALPTNWLDEGELVWPYWHGRMYGVRSALVAANTYGPEGAIAFCGASAVLDGGRVLASAPVVGNAVIAADLSDLASTAT